MNYSDFLSKICRDMEKRYTKASVSIQPVLKNNSRRLDGLLILQPGENIAPTIYLNPYYTRYRQGSSLNDLLDEIADIYEAHRFPSLFDLSLLHDFNRVRDRICFRLINRASNLELLADIPYFPFLDLAIVFFFTLEDEIIGSSTVLIHNSHLALWGTTKEALFSLAKTNTPTLSGHELVPMERLIFPDVQKECLSSHSTTDLFVLSNKNRLFGAACLLYKDLLPSFADMLRDDFYVLPSSIHEVLLLPVKKSPPPNSLLEMVQDINRTEVGPEDVLSDHIYLYQARENRLGIVLLAGYSNPQKSFMGQPIG
ncbi:MAG: hypothetical protein HFI67_03190 [Lachnospiraceae bacterium]|nr:hypothetical protein [Lachnospiraceae bacterium]